ncbi:flagellar motor protein MotB [Teichococcus aestuarii]|uniref:flagellar motor protein MotB n=1 Tax=Teichococcus aestuarii TaxID=568898 RepID=UPI0036237FF2
MNGQATRQGDPSPTIVIRREEEGEEHAHHGGAWKIAYADFVTAMMAFFLLMWLINATTDAQRRGGRLFRAHQHPRPRGVRLRRALRRPHHEQ